MELRKRNESSTKEFVDVLAVHWSADGRIEPIRIQLEDGTVLIVSKVFDTRRAASLRAGGQGIRYDCRVANEQDGHELRLHLFHDGDYWFIEKAESGDCILCADGTTQKLIGKKCKT